MDPELAEQIVDMLEREGDDFGGPDSFVGETEDRRLLRTAVNAIRDLQTAVLAPYTKRPPKFQPIRGPVPEWKRVQDERDKDAVDEMLAYYGIE